MLKKNVLMLSFVAILLLLIMSYFLMENNQKEVYQGLLATERNTFHTVILHDDVSKLQDEDIILPSKALEGGTKWLEYDPNSSLNYKEEFDINQFPVFLVFNTKELVLKAYDLDELHQFFNR